MASLKAIHLASASASAGLAAKRRYAIVGIFIFAAILTPPDVISQIGLAIPIILLYEVSIIGARMIERKRARRDDDVDAGDAGGEPEKGTA